MMLLHCSSVLTQIRTYTPTVDLSQNAEEGEYLCENIKGINTDKNIYYSLFLKILATYQEGSLLFLQPATNWR